MNNEGPLAAGKVLVVGGTGMLRPAVHELLERGSTVFGVARRPRRALPPRSGRGEYIPVEGDWRQPEVFGEAILRLLRARKAPTAIEGALLWVHSPHRQAVLEQLQRVLTPNATLVQVWGSATQDPRQVMLDEAWTHESWSLRHLFLGYHPGSGAPRWLTNEEISGAALEAWDNDGEHVVAGQIDPWQHRP